MLLQCFNSRTREGCDGGTERSPAVHHSFNSRTREGCDLAFQTDGSIWQVSIHAPGRGAT